MSRNEDEQHMDKSRSNDLVIAPVIVFISWYLFSYLWLYPYIYRTQPKNTFLPIVTILISIRIITGIWTAILTKRHGLKQNIWVVLALLIGPTQLILMNFSIWHIQSDTIKNKSQL